MTDRRKVLMLLLYGAATLAVAAPAHAGQGDDGGHDAGGGDNSGSGSGSNSGGGKGSGRSGGNSGAGDGRSSNRDLTSPSDASASKVSGKSANGEDEDEDDDARIKDWVKKGEAAPLSEVLKTVRENYNGKVVNVKLVGKDKPVVYKIRIIDQKNNLIEVQVDARKATIVGSAAAGIY